MALFSVWESNEQWCYAWQFHIFYFTNTGNKVNNKHFCHITAWNPLPTLPPNTFTDYFNRSWARWLATAILVSFDSPCTANHTTNTKHQFLHHHTLTKILLQNKVTQHNVRVIWQEVKQWVITWVMCFWNIKVLNINSFPLNLNHACSKEWLRIIDTCNWICCEKITAFWHMMTCNLAENYTESYPRRT